MQRAPSLQVSAGFGGGRVLGRSEGTGRAVRGEERLAQACVCQGVCPVRCCSWALPRIWGSAGLGPQAACDSRHRRAEVGARSGTEPGCPPRDRGAAAARGLNAWLCLRAGLALVSCWGGKGLDPVCKVAESSRGARPPLGCAAGVRLGLGWL